MSDFSMRVIQSKLLNILPSPADQVVDYHHTFGGRSKLGIRLEVYAKLLVNMVSPMKLFGALCLLWILEHRKQNFNTASYGLTIGARKAFIRTIEVEVAL